VAGKKLVYVAGPYTNPDPVENTHNAIKFCTELLDDGVVTPICPHLSMLWHAVTPRPYRTWLDYDLELLDLCDAVYRLPGQSSGADAEVQHALNDLGLIVFHEKNALYTWARGDGFRFAA